VSAECTIDLAIKVLSIALFFTMYMIKYNSFRINIHIVSWNFCYIQLNKYNKPDFTQDSSFPNFQRGYYKIILTIGEAILGRASAYL